jgi:opacity protein-like surface antigen
MKTILTAATLAVMALSTAAFASPPEGRPGGKGPMMDKFFEEADTNGDGVISKDEALANAARRFDEKDTNNDGKLTKEEIQAHFAAMKEKFGGQRPPREGGPSKDAE